MHSEFHDKNPQLIIISYVVNTERNSVSFLFQLLAAKFCEKLEIP